MKIDFSLNTKYFQRIKPASVDKTSSLHHAMVSGQNSKTYFSNNIFHHLGAIQNYNIAFLGIKADKSNNKQNDEPLYAIDAYENFKRFDNPDEAAEAFNVSRQKILKCANGDSESVGDLLFAFADNVEEIGRDGKKVPDKLIIKLASDVLYSISENKTKSPLTIDEALDTKTTSANKRGRPSKIENQSGTIEAEPVSEKKSASRIENPTEKEDTAKGAIYAIDKNHKYMKFQKMQELLDTLDISKGSVYKCLRGEKDHINGIVFRYDFDIERRNGDGELAPSKRLISKHTNCLRNIDAYTTLDLLVLRKQGEKHTGGIKGKVKGGILATIPEEDLSSVQLRYLQKPFYVADKDKNYRKFYLQKYVADALGIHKGKISDCLQGRISHFKDYNFVYANEVETVDKQGNITVDENKLFNSDERKVSFYLVGKNGKHPKFDNPKDAHNKLGISYNALLCCILGRQDKISDYAFVKAKDLEIENEDGSISINQARLQEAVELLNEGAVYLSKEKNKYDRYNSRAEAARAIDVLPSDISAAVHGRKKTVHGYVALDAKEVEEILSNGKINVNLDKINKALDLSKEIRTVDVSENGFYAIDKAKKYKKFFDITKASKKLDIPYTRILNCLLGVEKMAKGYVFALGEDIDIREKDGSISADKIKIAEKAAYFESKAIYAIAKNGQCRRFTSQKEASDILKIPLKNISRCINKAIKETYEYSFLTAREVEIETDDDKPILDEDLIQDRINYLNRSAVYAIDENNKGLRFEERGIAEEKIGVKKASITDCLKGKYKTSHGYVFAFPWEVEIRLEDGTCVPDQNKIIEKRARVLAQAS